MYNTNRKEKNNVAFIDKKGGNKLPWLVNPGRLWSLEDMLKISATRYVTIGQYLQQITVNLKKAAADDPPSIGLEQIAFIKRLILLFTKRK